MSTRLLALFLPALVLACSFRRQPPAGASGPEIYRLQNCANCHGEACEGTRLGPPLAGLRAHWNEQSLAGFLADPPAQVARDPRLAAFEATYGSSRMGAYDNLDPGQRLTLAEWLLAAQGTK